MGSIILDDDDENEEENVIEKEFNINEIKIKYNDDSSDFGSFEGETLT